MGMAAVEGVEVTDLDAAGLLTLAAETESRERQAGRNKLVLAYQWCVMHPANADSGAAGWGQVALGGCEQPDELLGGEGTPAVSAFAPEPLAAALGVSTASGMQLMADSLDLVHRLPLLWGRTLDLSVPSWKARKVAQQVHALSVEAAAYVDRHLADRLRDCGWVLIERVVAQAVANFHPELQAARERRGRSGWDVTVNHRPHTEGFDATSELHAAGDTQDITRFYDLVCEQAEVLASLGDSDPLGARKTKALGVIADRQATLELGPNTAPRPRAATRLFVHVDLADLAEQAPRVGSAERLGPVTIERIREWLSQSQVTVTPVLDMNRSTALDRHDPPDWMRELVIQRDQHCVFPWCTRDARRADLDHITPFDTGKPDDPGPPGQTRPDNLAPLCRRHHRIKTVGGWSYARGPDTRYTWTTPHGRSYLVDSTGTRSLSGD